MKKGIVFYLLFGVMLMAAFSQEKILNTEMPTNKDSGRMIKLKPVVVITDEDEGYYFKWPYNLKVSHDGCIFVQDKNQLLKFTADGKFVKNYVKSGQGPGETQTITNYIPLEDDSIYIHNRAPNKILRINNEGKLLEEIRLPFEKWADLIHVNDDFFYFIFNDAPDTKGGVKVTDLNKKFFSVSRKDFSVEDKFSLPVKTFMLNNSEAFVMVKLIYLSGCRFKDNLFYFNHTPEYGVKLVDLDRKEFLMDIRRKYDRVKVTDYTKKFILYGGFSYGGKIHQSPIPKYMNDIQSVHVDNNRLLVITSTVDKDKGVLVDVFNEKGKYIDYFYLKLPGEDIHFQLIQSAVTFKNGFLYTLEKNEDGNWLLKKYLVSPNS